jgi:hypothetical protein
VHLVVLGELARLVLEELEQAGELGAFAVEIVERSSTP